MFRSDAGGVRRRGIGVYMHQLKSRAVRVALAVLTAAGLLTAASTGPTAAGVQAAPPERAPAPLDLPCAEYPGGDTVCSGEEIGRAHV